MPVDPEYLRQHYASLSDEGLLAIDRADLVEAAQKCYDDELRRRELASPRGGQSLSEQAQERHDAPRRAAEDKPDWLDEGSEVYSRTDAPGVPPSPDLANARDALEAAGIPCYLDLSELPGEESVTRPATHLWRVMVPGDLNLHATSVLERDIFNADFEAEWRTHLEMFSDEELHAMHPRDVFCGLFDRIERVTKAYEDELARRSR